MPREGLAAPPLPTKTNQTVLLTYFVWIARVCVLPSPPPAPPLFVARVFYPAYNNKKKFAGCGAHRGGAGLPHPRPLLPRVRQSPQHRGGEGVGGEQEPAKEGSWRELGGRDRRGDFPGRAAGRPTVRAGFMSTWLDRADVVLVPEGVVSLFMFGILWSLGRVDAQRPYQC